MEEATHEISLDVIIRAIFGITDLDRATRFRDAFLEFSRPRPLFLFRVDAARVWRPRPGPRCCDSATASTRSSRRRSSYAACRPRPRISSAS